MNDQIKTRRQLIEELQELRQKVAKLQEPGNQPQQTKEPLGTETLRHALFDNIADPIFIFDQETRHVLDCNQAMIDRYGYTLDELRTMTPHDLHPPEEVEIVERNIDDRDDTSAHHYTHVTKDGRRLQVEVLTKEGEYDGRDAWISVIRDITERKRAESEIIKLNLELTAINDIGQALVSTLDLQETLTVITDHLTRLMDVKAASVLLLDEAKKELRFAAASGAGADFIRNMRIKLGQGIAGWVAQHGKPVMVPDVSQDKRWFADFDPESGLSTRSILCVPLQAKGKIIGALEVMNKEHGTFVQEDMQLLASLAAPAATAIETARLYDQAQSEIVEHMRAEEALRESEEKYREILANIEEGYFEVDLGGNFVFFNDTLCHLLGYPADELMGMNNRQYMDEKNALQVFQTFNTVYQTREPATVFDWEIIAKDRTKKLVESSVSLIRDAAGEPVGFRGIVRDVTERRQAELERKRLLDTLEHRSTQLQTAAEVSRAAGSILDPETLGPQVVDLVRERFNLYYVGLFLVDQTGEWTRDQLDRPEPYKWAVLRAGTGKAGLSRLEKGYKLEIGDSSTIGWCIANKQARITLDVGKEAADGKDARLPETRSELALPLISRGESIGALSIQSDQQAAFSEEDIIVLQTMADQLANAIANARLYDQAKQAEENARRRVAQTTVIYEVGQRVSGELELETLLSEIVTVVRDAFDYYGVMLLLHDEATDRLILQSSAGGYANVFPENISIAIGEGMIGRAAATGKPQISGNVDKSPYYVRKADEGTRSELSVPIKSGQKVIGVLDLQGDKYDAFDESDVLIMETMADQIATAIKNARLFETMQVSEEKYRSVVENASEAIFVTQDGMLKFGNRQSTAIAGYSEQDLTTQSFADFIHPDDQRIVSKSHATWMQEDGAPTDAYPFRIIAKDGSVKWVELKAVIVDWEGKPATLNFMSDITARRQAEEAMRQAEQRYRAVAGSAVTGIGIVDREEILTFVNPAFADMLGYTPDELEGMNLSRLTTPEEFARYQERTQERQQDEGAYSHYETALRCKDGSTLNIIISGSPLTAADGSFQGTIAVIVDISERKRAVDALQKALDDLEQYTYNLERQAAQLQVGAEVAREAAAILDVQRLLDTAVRLISEGFGFYHAGAFLVDEQREYAIMRAASSPGGQRMLERGHKLSLGKVGIVGYVAETGKARVALNVGEDAMHFAHDDLPNTRSEMGLPLNVRGRTIGVLDVQDTQANAFTDNDVAAMQTLADQLAVAIDNARLVERTDVQLRELSLFYGEYSASTWAELVSPDRATGYIYDRIDVMQTDRLSMPALDMALASGETVTHGEVNTPPGKGGEKTLATPLKLHDKIIGSLGIQEADRNREWSSNDIALIEAVSDQVSLALENAQHFSETQKSAQQMQILNELARSLATRLTEQEVLQETYWGASRLLDTTNFFIAFYDFITKTIEFPLAVENDQGIEWEPRKAGNGLTEYVIREKQPLLIREDVAGWLKEKEIEAIGVTALSWLGVPLMVGGRVIGVMVVQSATTPQMYDARDRDLLTGIASQTAIALQNTRLFQETEAALSETEVLYSVSEIIGQLEGLEETFQALGYVMIEQLGYTTAWFGLVDTQTKTVTGISGTGIREDLIKVEIPLDPELCDPVVQSVLTRSPILINDVANDERTADMGERARASIGHLLEVPILVGIDAGGVIAVTRSADKPKIIKRDMEVLQVVADQAAVALQNIRLLETTRRRAEQERRILEITSKIRRSSNITTILQTAVDELGMALQTDRAMVRLAVKSRETQDTE